MNAAGVSEKLLTLSKQNYRSIDHIFPIISINMSTEEKVRL